MAALVSQLVALAATAFVTEQGNTLVTSIPFGCNHPWFAPLNQALGTLAPNQITAATILPELNVVPGDARDAFAAFLSAVLRNIQAGADSALENADEGATFEAFNAVVAIHTELHKLYSSSGPDAGYAYPFLNGIVLEVSRQLVWLSDLAASRSTAALRDHNSARGIKDATRQCLEKSMQVSASHMTGTEWRSEADRSASVGDIMWPLANILWRIYAKRKLHTQATELFKTFNQIQPSEEVRLQTRGALVSRADVAESYYWRGRLGVVLLDMRMSRPWLEKAWRFCPEDAWQQRRAILIRLIPVSLLMGRLPRPGLLEQYSLDQEFAPLLHAFRTGNVAAWRAHVHERRHWLRARSIWLLLFERGEILVWRNLFRFALVSYYTINPAASKNRCPTDVFVAATARTFKGTGELEDGTVALEDVICVLSSLIDQSLIRGQLAYSSTSLVLKPSPDGVSGGFPPLASVTPRRVEAIV